MHSIPPRIRLPIITFVRLFCRAPASGFDQTKFRPKRNPRREESEMKNQAPSSAVSASEGATLPSFCTLNSVPVARRHQSRWSERAIDEVDRVLPIRRGYPRTFRRHIDIDLGPEPELSRQINAWFDGEPDARNQSPRLSRLQIVDIGA